MRPSPIRTTAGARRSLSLHPAALGPTAVPVFRLARPLSSAQQESATRFSRRRRSAAISGARALASLIQRPYVGVLDLGAQVLLYGFVQPLTEIIEAFKVL